MIWRLTYCNKKGVEARVDIQKGLATPVIEVEGTGQPFILSYNNDKGNKSGLFLSSSADIEVYETPDFNIDNLKTSNETELSVTYYIDNVVKWKGFIIPDFFSIEVRDNPVIAMTASDRLGTLKNVTLTDLSAMVNIRELAIMCLNKTGLSLPLNTIADFSNDGMSNAFFNYYIDSQRIKDIKGRSISCYDILSSILIAINSKLVQREGEWVIINKLQHEIGSGNVYSSLNNFTAYLENIYNFQNVSVGARRTITPVAGSIGIYHEHGGRKSHPANYDFSLDLSGWNSNNGFVATIENKHITGYLGGTPMFDPDRVVKQYLLNYNNWIDNMNNLNTAPYISTDPIPINSPRADRVEVTVDISSTMAERLSSNTMISFLRYAVILTNGTKTYTLTKAGIFEELDPENISGHSLLLRGGQQAPLLLASPALSNPETLKGLFEVGEEDNVNDYSATIRIYGSGDQYVTVNYALIKFSDVSEIPKGTIYKVEQGEVFTKAYDVETSIFGDYLLSGLNGYFYRYPNDDTSSIYKNVDTLSNPVWTTPMVPNETSELPLLHHSARQMRRLFSVAHDLLSAQVEADNFDPLAIFVDCNDNRYTVVSAQFDFFRSSLSVELEEVAYQNNIIRDFIYSYFGEGEDTIKSIGGIAGGGGGTGGGGGMTSEQLEMLTNLADWWKLDEDNDAIYSEKSVYSLKGVSALGLGSGGGGGGADMLDSWGNYTEAKANYYVPASLLVPFRNDTLSRLTSLESGSATSIETTGSGNAITSLTKSGNVITANKGLAFALSSHTHTIAQITGLQGALDSKASQSDITTAINGIEIGGRNLIREVDIMSLGSNASKGVDDFGQYIRFLTLNPDSPRFTHVKYEDNTQYTLSVEASVETGSHLYWYFVYTDGSNSGIYSTILINTSTPVIRRATSAINKTIDYIAYTWGSAGYRRIYNIKLEKGNKPTDWTPAPEDQVANWNETNTSSYSYIKNKPSTVWGQPLSGIVSGALTGVTDITASGSVIVQGTKGRYTRMLGGSFRTFGSNTGWVMGLYHYGNDGSTNFGLSAGAYGNVNTLNYYFYGGSYTAPSMVILPNGNVGIGTTSPSQKLHVRGNILSTGEITAYVASDRRLKENITSITSALDYINRLNPVTYNWNARAKELNSNKPNSLDYGLIAQEVEEILPNIVHGIFDDKYKSIDYIKLIPIMVGAIKELKQEINRLKIK